jgi:septal ring factor EnvC (AmiA/AmiB activator)
MKPKTLISIFLSVILLMMGITFVSEMSDRDRLKQVEIDHLKKEIAEQRDSLESVLKVTQDSLDIAFETIKQANIERQAAHERSQKTIRDLQRIVFITHSDSSRNKVLKQLYPTFNP